MQPLVAPGDFVEAGQRIAESFANERWYRCWHAPLASVVANPSSRAPSPCAGIERTDPFLELVVQTPSLLPSHSIQHHQPTAYQAAEIVELSRRAGLVGMGGGMFPTYAKLATSNPIDCVIVNGCEGEPYLTCDHRVLVEHRDEVECGMRLAMRALGAVQGTIVERDESYLDGYEVRLVENVLGRLVPRGGRPSDVGVVVINVQSARALHRAVCEKRPLLDRVVTVDGNAIRRPGNYEIPIGTELQHVLDVCGVSWDQDPTLIAGGPIMGRRVEPDAVVTPGTGGILALTSDERYVSQDLPCIRCGRCQEVCPLDLPSGQLLRRPTNALLDCIECGMCQFACPSQRPMIQQIRTVKSRLRRAGH